MLRGFLRSFSSKLGTGNTRSSCAATFKPLLATALAAVVCLLAVPALAQNTWTVNTLADSNDGSCSASTCSLRDALTAAGGDSGDTILFQSGLTGTITLTGNPPFIQTSMTITGPGASQLTVSGNNLYHVFMVFSGTVNISGLTIANGNDGGEAGAGIMNFGTLTVAGCAFTGNSASYGGGAISNDGPLTVIDSTFSGNSGYYNGGAIANYTGSSSGTLTVINSTFTGNSAPSGGGIYQQGGPITVTNSTFSGNSGGGMTNGGGTVTVNNSILDNCSGCSSSQSNLIGGSPMLGALGWNGGPTETMMPLPGSPAICAGLFSNFPSGVTSDQRGWPVSPSTCPSGQVDAGAVQTNYLTVNTLADSSNSGDATSCSDGTESATNTCSLRDALGQANTAGQADVDFAPSLFLSGTPAVSTPGTINLATGTNTPLPGISGQLNLVGPGANLLTVSGGNSPAVGSVLTVNSTATAFIEGLTISGGNRRRLWRRHL